MIRCIFRALLLMIFCLGGNELTAAVKRWNGSSSKDWNDVLNWTPAGLPLDTDEVLFDNLLLTNDYTVSFPVSSVAIFSLEILPSPGRKIEINIPVTNLAVPALSLTSSGNSLLLHAGSVFKNSSGITSGQSLMIGGKLVIKNGGTYIHNTRASHASGIIAKLSTDAGTEQGIFEFDVPGGAYALSLSNRNYGSLKLSATASDGTQTYNATGTSVTNIRGDLHIGSGVVFNLDLEKTLTIGGDFLQSGGVFNLANQPNNLQIIFKNSFIQDSAAVITETSAGLPEISFEGVSSQLVSVRGSVLNSITIAINNQYGIFLNSDLRIPYALKLKSGNIRSFPTAMVRLADNALVTSASPLSFVDGPVMKTGDEDFEFPVGRQGDYAPLKLTGTGRAITTQCIAEYHHGNPQETFGAGIGDSKVLRISSLEYWTVDQSSPLLQEKVSLSVGPYSHATSLEKLVISHWDNEQQSWINLGNSAYSGVSSGTITSEAANIRGIFSIGTTVADQNPLPVYFEGLKGEWLGEEIRLTWRAHNQSSLDRYSIGFSEDGMIFRSAESFAADSLTEDYVFSGIIPASTGIYARVSLLAGGEREVQSQTVFVKRPKQRIAFSLYPSPAREAVNLEIITDKEELIIIEILDQNAGILQSIPRHLKRGKNKIPISLSNLDPGMYFARVKNRSGTTATKRFIKL